MKLIFTVIVLALSLSSLAQTELMQDAIDRPSLSTRCKDLLQERADKIKIQQKLSGLLQRTEGLLRKTPATKLTITRRLESSRIKIKNELYLINLKIEAMSENIVRSGCPGLSLQ